MRVCLVLALAWHAEKMSRGKTVLADDTGTMWRQDEQADDGLIIREAVAVQADGEQQALVEATEAAERAGAEAASALAQQLAAAEAEAEAAHATVAALERELNVMQAQQEAEEQTLAALAQDQQDHEASLAALENNLEDTQRLKTRSFHDFIDQTTWYLMAVNLAEDTITKITGDGLTGEVLYGGLNSTIKKSREVDSWVLFKDRLHNVFRPDEGYGYRGQNFWLSDAEGAPNIKFKQVAEGKQATTSNGQTNFTAKVYTFPSLKDYCGEDVSELPPSPFRYADKSQPGYKKHGLTPTVSDFFGSAQTFPESDFADHTLLYAPWLGYGAGDTPWEPRMVTRPGFKHRHVLIMKHRTLKGMEALPPAERVEHARYVLAVENARAPGAFKKTPEGLPALTDGQRRELENELLFGRGDSTFATSGQTVEVKDADGNPVTRTLTLKTTRGEDVPATLGIYTRISKNAETGYKDSTGWRPARVAAAWNVDPEFAE